MLMLFAVMFKESIVSQKDFAATLALAAVIHSPAVMFLPLVSAQISLGPLAGESGAAPLGATF